MATQWGVLLNRAVAGLATLKDQGIGLRHWTFGGGTALMLRVQHRDSKDIDLFVTDPQLLGYLSPRLAGETIWDTPDYDESAHTLKLRYEEGEIDFIVAGAISDLPTETFDYGDVPIQMEHPVEIILKKLVYRDTGFKPRDIFDTAVILQKYEDVLLGHMHLVSKSKEALMERISGMPDTYFEAAMEELDVRPEWRWIIPKAKQFVIDLVCAIPAPPESTPRPVLQERLAKTAQTP